MECDKVKWLKYVIGFVIVVAFLTVVLFNLTTKIEANQLEEKVSTLEEQIGNHYRSDLYLWEDAAEQLLTFDFSQPITEENKNEIFRLSRLFNTASENLFFRLRTESAHPELYSKLSEVDRYFLTYDDKGSLTEKQVADLYQVLHAVRFIAKDINDLTRYDMQALYDAMNDEEHEIGERIKYRLSIEY